MTLIHPRNSLSGVQDQSGKTIAILQVAVAQEEAKLNALRFETRFLENVRSKITGEMIDEENEDLSKVVLTLKEYQTLVSFIPKLKEEESLLGRSNESLKQEQIKLIEQTSVLSKTKESIERELTVRRAHLEGVMQSTDNEITVKKKNLNDLKVELDLKEKELAELLTTISSESESLSGKKLELQEYQEFLENKARDLMRLERRVERGWNTKFPKDRMLMKENRPLVDSVEEFSDTIRE